MTGRAGPCRILVVRPAPDNAATLARLEALGCEARAAPLFAIAPLAWSASAADRFDALLLTSGNAVRMAGSGIHAYRDLPAWCVGAATADAARNAGLSVARVGAGGVAAMLDGKAERILWLCGEDRTALCVGQAARVEAVPVYRAVELAIAPDWFAAPAILLLHSSRAARRMAMLVPDRSGMDLIAISAAVAAAAGDGWRSITIADRPADSDMVAIAAKLCQKRR
jgi:uroporphyrinogen-III synthase